MIRSSSSSEYLFIHLPVPDLYLYSRPVPCLRSCQSHLLLWQWPITNATGRLCCPSTELLMQHIHKHPRGMLADVWKKQMWESIAGCSSCTGFCEGSRRSTVNWEHSRFPLIIQISSCFYFSFFHLLLCADGFEMEGFAVSELKWFGRVNGSGLAQRRFVVDEGSVPGISVWAFRRSTMSFWEAPSATSRAVWPFWGGKQKKVKFHVKDTVVTALILTVAVLLLH